jgi:D-sedoheptulose 7-phosphate isomerase
VSGFGTLRDHLSDLRAALLDLQRQEPLLESWGRTLAMVLSGGGRLLAAGNGGSAAEAQHLTAELTGRFQISRPALSAIALNAETSSVTAIGNDFGFPHVFARQVEAHGRRGDVLLMLSTSGRSPNLLQAAHSARRAGVQVWAMTGASPNPLAEAADSALAVRSRSATAVQEAHLVAVHGLCAALERHLPDGGRQDGQSMIAGAVR